MHWLATAPCCNAIGDVSRRGPSMDPLSVAAAKMQLDATVPQVSRSRWRESRQRHAGHLNSGQSTLCCVALGSCAAARARQTYNTNRNDQQEWPGSPVHSTVRQCNYAVHVCYSVSGIAFNLTLQSASWTTWWHVP